MSTVGGIGGAGSIGYTPAPRPAQRPASPGDPTFADQLKFSKHATERVQRRGIDTRDPQTAARLEKGVELAAAKGSRAAVVLIDSTAFVVAPQNRTVITAVDQARMREQVFTNIDTAVIA
ncbi:MAG: flagellar biosynthesis protein [Actinobacteria bacterium]|nr:flagellar biosynthesis protein [Actinomycetota bacterium]